LQQYKPVQLRYDIKTIVNPNYEVRNFGDSKGLSFDRMLIYPTKPRLAWLQNNNSQLADTSRSIYMLL
jgi:hypothetical protein